MWTSTAVNFAGQAFQKRLRFADFWDVEKYYSRGFYTGDGPWNSILQRYYRLYQGQQLIDIHQNYDKLNNIIFHVFVLMQVCSILNSRREVKVFRKCFKNLIFVACLVCVISFQIIIVQFGGQLFETVPLSWKDHLMCLLLGGIPVLLNPVFRRFVP